MAMLAAGSGLGTLGLRRSGGWLAGLAVCLAVVVLLPGCGGCRRAAVPKTPEDAEEALAQRQEKLRKPERKPDLEVGFPPKNTPLLACQPHEPKPDRSWYKPRHLTVATLPAKSNHFDLVGDLETTVLDGRGDPIRLEGMPFTMSGLRPIALSKGRRKIIEPLLFVPGDEPVAAISCRIRGRKGTGVDWQTRPILARMPAYQYHFVVLARLPELYGYVKDLDSLKAPTGLQGRDPVGAYYRIALLEAQGRVALPSRGLCWTSIAYVLWDDADPETLSLDQQLALLDWLHWGGQLIISGPDSLDTLRGSFLTEYLPVSSWPTRELTAADFDELNRRWTLPIHDSPGRPLEPLKSWTGVELKKVSQARDVPGTGGLLVERRVGRGRVVVSAFRLGERTFKTWPSCDGFFNACLLGRPPRRFGIDEVGDVNVAWADNPALQLDPRRTCNLRYFARDAVEKFELPAVPNQGMMFGYRQESEDVFGSDVASWNDFSSVANLARESLQRAAKIEIPERTFVVWVVAGYLVVLVPINWGLFRLLGRVEWAWVAAPGIAVICTLIVIRMARLDIGFARSATEIAVVELQSDYPRAHVTRYTALYTSLSTAYELYSEDPGAQILPLAGAGPSSESSSGGGGKIEWCYGKDVGLRGFRVRSNLTGFTHTEQMVDLGGSLVLTTSGFGATVANRTRYTVHGAGLMHKDEQGNVRTAWLGTLEPGASVEANFKRAALSDNGGSLWEAQRNRSKRTAREAPEGELNLRALCELAEATSDVVRQGRGTVTNERLALLPGEYRLVGWLDEEVPGLEIKPAAPQSRHAALVVAHLRYGFERDPKPDANTRADVTRIPLRTLTP